MRPCLAPETQPDPYLCSDRPFPTTFHQCPTSTLTGSEPHGPVYPTPGVCPSQISLSGILSYLCCSQSTFTAAAGQPLYLSFLELKHALQTRTQQWNPPLSHFLHCTELIAFSKLHVLLDTWRGQILETMVSRRQVNGSQLTSFVCSPFASGLCVS